MTRLEKFRTAEPEEIAKILCGILDETNNYDKYVTPCDVCVASQWCYKGHTGFIDWLNKEENGMEDR